MPRTLAALALVLAAGPAFAVISKPIPLKEVLADEKFIFTATVEKVEPDKPGVVFTRTGDLKGKSPFDRLAVNLTGDSDAKRGNHTKEMLARLAVGRTLVFFASPVGRNYSAFGFLEGTWFQLQGTTDADGQTVRWAFLHCEPYLRKTFKGTTADLTTTVTECLAGKRQPPALDEKEPPGLGPLPEKKEEKKPTAAVTSPVLFAVIPSFVLIGPLAIVAALFPTAAAGMAAGLRKWRAFMVIASVNSTTALAYFLFRDNGLLPDSSWFAPPAVGVYLLVATSVGTGWAARRYRRSVGEPDATTLPTRKELIAIAGAAGATGLLVAATAWWAGWPEALYPAGTPTAGQPPSGLGKEFTAIFVGLTAGALYAGYRLLTRSVDGDPPPVVRLSLSGETVGLVGVLAFSATVWLVTLSPDRGTASLTGELGNAGTGDVGAGPKLTDCTLLFVTDDYHDVMSSIAVTPMHLYFGVGKQTGFRSGGAVFAVDRASGKEAWRFVPDESKQVFATPAVSGGRVFAGEGLHRDSGCRLFALDAATGKPVWSEPVATASHTEGTPRVVNGKVYFSAGDDGLYCASAADGKVIWHAEGASQSLHVDTPVAVAGGRVFAGSGYRTLALFALDAETKAELWRVPVALRSFGPPLVLGDRVAFGLGTGNLGEDLAHDPSEGRPAETTPAGLVVCLDTATGKEAWKAEFPKSVHTALAADATTVYAACRDGSVYALDRATGKLRWRRAVGSALTTGPAIATYAGGRFTLAVYAVSSQGLVACLHPADGRVLWTRDLRAQTGRDVQVYSTPVVATDEAGTKRHVFFGAMLTNRNSGAKTAAVFRIEDVVE